MTIIIYKTLCLITNLIYVGYHVIKNTKTMDPGYIGSGSDFSLVVKLYGKKNFKREIIEVFHSKSDVEWKETFWIDFFDATNPLTGYNICKKGGISGMYGLKQKEKTKKKISEKVAGEGNPMYGRKQSENSKRKNREAHLGNKNALGAIRTPEMNEKNRIAHLGKKQSEEAKRKNSESNKGEKNGMFGKHYESLLKGTKLPDVVKDKISKKLTGIKQSPETIAKKIATRARNKLLKQQNLQIENNDNNQSSLESDNKDHGKEN